MMPPRIDVSRQDIADVVQAFYVNVRGHDLLGPIFAKHVVDWAAHEEKIICFWASAIRHEKSYDGNPMQTHMQVRDIRSHHFVTWLALFDETLERLVASPQREQWSHLAHRIGRGLSMGVEDMHRPADAIPQL
jgi:hemoglobin